MKRMIIACVALVSSLLLSASFASAAKPTDRPSGGKSAAAKACVAEKKADKASFNATYGKHAMRNCIKGEVEAGDDSGEPKNAAKACKAERAADSAAFQAQYGSNENGKNAFGKCVSSKSKDSVDDDDADDDDVDDVDDDAGDDDGSDDVDDDAGEEVPVP